MMLMYLDKTKK